MMHTLIRLRLLFAALTLSVIINGCDFSEIKSQATTGEMLISVDENLEPWMKAAESEFERINPEAKLDLRFVPTNNAVAELINKQVKTIVVSRSFTQEERGIIDKYNIKIDSHKVAVDGIAFITNKDNPAVRLTSEELKKIFTGEIKTWADIKSQDDEQNKNVLKQFGSSKIKVYIQRKNSYTYDYIKENLLKGGEFINTAVVCSTSVQMMNEIKNDKNGIGISNSAWLSTGNQEELDSTVTAVRVAAVSETGRQLDYVQFHQGFVFNGTYPYRREVYLYTTEEGISLATGLVTFMIGKDGQKIVLKQGLVPVSQPVRTIQLN